MATVDKKRSAYMTLLELGILMHTYGKHEHIFRKKKQNMVAASKERDLVGEKITARVNV